MPPHSLTPAADRQETVLLADDEPTVRDLGRAILQRLGYRVLVAADGAEAVDVYCREPGGIDLVILDLSMPRLSGPDAFQRLLMIDPNVRVLFASGYPVECLEAYHERILGFLEKPYLLEDFALTVCLALEAARPPRPDTSVPTPSGSLTIPQTR
jgi:DNA-binding NtrC family response regulator